MRQQRRRSPIKARRSFSRERDRNRKIARRESPRDRRDKVSKQR